MNAPIQSEQVDETCGSGRVGLYLESLGMSAFFEIISNRQSRQRLDRHGTIVVGSCETFHHYNVQGVK